MTKESDTASIYGLPLTIYESQIEATMKATQLFGHSRDVVKSRYALRTPAGFVPSCLPGWRNCVAITQISPGMGACFCQFQIDLEKTGEGRGDSGGNELFVYCVEGKCAAEIGAT